MENVNKDDNDVQLRLQLEQDRHERRLDWVAVCVLFILVFVSILVVIQAMQPDAPPSFAEGSAWAKTFLTTVGGVVIGVLSRGRFRKSDRPQKPAD